MKLSKGDRIYNRGDMANRDHFGTVTAVSHSRYGTQYQITPDDADCGPYWVSQCIVKPEDKGNGSTRIVTEKAHRVWHDKQIANMQARMLRKEGVNHAAP